MARPAKYDKPIEPRKNRVIVLEDLNFVWDGSELYALRKLWNKGRSIEHISDHFHRDPDEILLALIHLAREDRIEARKGGLF